MFVSGLTSDQLGSLAPNDMMNEAMNDATSPEVIQEDTLDDKGYNKYLEKLYMG